MFIWLQIEIMVSKNLAKDAASFQLKHLDERPAIYWQR